VSTITQPDVSVYRTSSNDAQRLSNIEGRAQAITVLSPIKPYWSIWLRILFWLTKKFPSITGPLRQLSFIHFARWNLVSRIPFNGPPQLKERLNYTYLLFTSNFNGTWDQYIDAFSYTVSRQMSLIWGSSYGFPGPMPVQPFKGHYQRPDLRNHRKLVVVDGRTGWVGAGFEDHFCNGEFHDLFLRLGGAVVSQLQLIAVATFRHHGVYIGDVTSLFPNHGSAPAHATPAVVLHNAPGPVRPVSDAVAELIDGARDTLDIANPYVTDRTIVRRLETAGRRGVRVRLVVPARPNNWACGSAQRHHHRQLLAAGVEIVEYPRMVHAKVFVRDGRDVLVGTCNLDAWSLRRSFEIAVRLQSPALAEEFAREFFTPAIAISRPGRVATTLVARALNALFACLSPLL